MTFLPTLAASLLVASAWVLQPPLGLDLHLPVPESNPLTREKVALGRRLFFDAQLSRDRTLSCAGCHDPVRAFSDGRPVARGIGGVDGSRNSPAIINRGYGSSFFLDGRADSLERQVLEPITNPKELGLSLPELELRTGLKAADVAAALASYVRTIRSGNSRFDQFVAGRADALTPNEKAGLELFRGRADCRNCHSGANFSDEQFHNTGVAWRQNSFADDGRFAVTRRDPDRGAFKTPTLRNVAQTAPYMHDGSIETLEEVVEFYAQGGRANPQKDAALRPIHLSPVERDNLVAFLKSLTGEVWFN